MTCSASSLVRQARNTPAVLWIPTLTAPHSSQVRSVCGYPERDCSAPTCFTSSGKRCLVLVTSLKSLPGLWGLVFSLMVFWGQCPVVFGARPVRLLGNGGRAFLVERRPPGQRIAE